MKQESRAESPGFLLLDNDHQDGFIAVIMDFIPLTTVDEWDALLKTSSGRTVVIFKHSATCGTSAYAYELIAQALQEGALAVVPHLVVVQTAHTVSSRIAADLGVVHQSPQVLVVRGGRCTYHTSHASIRPTKLQTAILAAEGAA